MSASKIASFLGIPRPTVLRRLTEAQAEGLLARDSHGRYSLTPARLNKPDREVRVRKSVALIKRAASDLK
jgi:DNA-binding IclR family transcriptional regulator